MSTAGIVYTQSELNKKLLNSLPRSWDLNVSIIKKTKNLNTLTLTELVSILKADDMDSKQREMSHLSAYATANSGSLIGFPVENIRVVMTDGASHNVDSSELAFRLASIYAFRQCYEKCKPVILEPVMLVELKVPTEFQGTVAGDLNRRKGIIVGNDQDGDDSVINALVPLNNMFGYSTALRSMTQGKGEFTMEYKEHSPVSADVQTQLVNAHKPKVSE